VDDPVLALRVAGVVAMLGALLYAVGDSLLLAVESPAGEHPRLAAHAKRLGDMARLAALDPRRIAPGGLVGVLATPLVMAGWWLLEDAAGRRWRPPPVLPFAAASVVGPSSAGSWRLPTTSPAVPRRRPAADAVAGGAPPQADRHRVRR
jgi:hypothetical protein